MLIRKEMTIPEIIKKYPETLTVFKNSGFNGLEQQEVLEKLKDLSLEKIMVIKKEDVNIFMEMLEQSITTVEKEKGEAKILGLLPCPVRIPLLEGFENFLEKNKDVNIDYELKAASAGLDWIKESVRKDENVDDLADMFMSAGFDLFFDKKLIGKFKEQGVFKDLTGIEHYNKDFENDEISLKDPHGDYSMIAVVPAVFIVNQKALNGRKIPESWEDLLKPEYENSVSLPISDFDLFNSILIHIYKMFGMDGIKSLSKNFLSNLHPAQMVESTEPLVTIMPYFFSKMIPEGGIKKVVWPKEGAIISPIFMLTKADKKEELQKVIDFMSGAEVGQMIASQGLFPSVNPDVKNPTTGKKFQWVGWDFIYSNDIGEKIEECKKVFEEGVKR